MSNKKKRISIFPPVPPLLPFHKCVSQVDDIKSSVSDQIQLRNIPFQGLRIQSNTRTDAVKIGGKNKE